MKRLAAILSAPALALIAGCTPQASVPAAATPPNIVFVLTDDLAMNLIKYMPHVQAMHHDGVAFANYSVTDSLCCPSRSSMFTGKFPHDTGIFTNGGKDGGYNAFHQRSEEGSTFATDLRKAGYRTAMMGKYLNGYQPKGLAVPPGWDEWDVAGNGYPEFDYDLNENGKLVHYGKQPADYLTDVLSAKASSFITASAAAKKPFMVEVATFAPHGPYTPAPRDASMFPGLTAPRQAAFDKLPAGAPSWLASRAPLTAAETAAIDKDFRKRAQAVQAVDKMIGSLRQTLDRTGVAGHTVVVFTSDNGYHMGEYRLNPGKMTAFDTDVHVPLVITGPGFAAGKTVSEPAENIDLRPTFDTLAGVPPGSDVDGHALGPLLSGSPVDWRDTALIEHHGPDIDPADPDRPAKNSGNPTTYAALRTTVFTYVEYADGEREYYDRRTDPDELSNTAAALSAVRVAQLHKTLAALAACHGSATCWSAARLS